VDATQSTIEEWRPVVGWEGSYEVSNYGRVRSIDRVVTRRDGGEARFKGQMLTLYRSPGHYFRVALPRSGGGQQWACVHKLVLDAFVGPRPVGLVACHNDGDHCNNHVSNLRWDTYSSNSYDKVKHGVDHQTLKTHCPRQHPYDAENTYIGRRGGRYCRHCKRERDERCRAEKRKGTT
jgi:hypothetical protein